MTRRSAGNRQKHENPNPLQRRLVERFHAETARLVNLVEPTSVLDLGCGEGYVLESLVSSGVSAALTGIDMSPQAVEAARDRLGDRAEIIEGDVTDLRPTLGRYDIVMMMEVLEHLDHPESALELVEGLTGSHVILSVPREPAFRGLNLLRLKNVRRLGNDPEHVQNWTKRGFQRFVSERFHVLETGNAFPWTMLLLAPRTAEPST